MNKPQILIVDENKGDIDFLCKLLKKKYKIISANDGQQALSIIAGSHPNLILMDGSVSGTDGTPLIDVLQQKERTADIPVILLTKEQDEESELKGLRAGAMDVIPKHTAPEILKKRIERILDLYGLRWDLEDQIQKKEEKIDYMSLQSILTIAHTIDAKDRYAEGHSVRVALYAKEIAARMGWNEKQVEELYYVALLHDIGNIAIHDFVLNKAGELTKEEYDSIKQHTVVGGDILKEVNSIPHAREGALYHHEWYNGKGYMGLSGNEIPEVCRIIAVADAYESMTTDRAFRKRLPQDQVIQELMKGRGTQFDPYVVDVFMELLAEGLSVDEKSVESSFEGEDEMIGETGALLRQVFDETVTESQNELQKDSLTGFLDRKYFEEKINRYLMTPKSSGTFFMMDLDNFKIINDTYGHMAGDTLLLVFSDVIRSNTRDKDYVCRMGGDEFAIFFPGMGRETVIRKRAENIIRMFAERKEELGYNECSISLGIMTKSSREKKMDYEVMYRNADKALYYVKNNGKDSYHFYSHVFEEPGTEDIMRNQLDVEQLIRQIAERKYRRGAYTVEYDRFSYIYQFIARNVERSSQQVQIILLSLHSGDELTVEEELEDQMMLLETAVIRSLRRGDVTTRMSNSQQIVILMDTNGENGNMVAKRILDKYDELAGERKYSISYELRGIPVKKKEKGDDI